MPTLYSSRNSPTSIIRRKRMAMNSDTLRADFKLPAALPPPPFAEVNNAAIVASCEELNGVAPFFIRQMLLDQSKILLDGLSNVSFYLPTRALPPMLEVSFKDTASGSVPPTHVFALSTPSQPRAYKLFLIHALPFAAHCTNLPLFPASPTQDGIPSEGRAKLPIIPLCVPHIDTFSILQSYIYKHDLEALKLALQPPKADAQGMVEGKAMVKHALFLLGLHKTACAFGFVDFDFYKALEEAWSRVVRFAATGN